MKKRNKVSKIVLIFLIIYFFVCIKIDNYIIDFLDEGHLITYFFMIVYLTLCYLICYTFIDVIVHETGHLILGILYKWKISSINILGISFKKENGKIVFHKKPINTISGYVEMYPKNEKQNMIIPYYGGIIFNLIFAIIFFMIIPCINNNFVLYFIIAFIVSNISLAITNSIPYQINAIYKTDMYQVYLIKDAIKKGIYPYYYKFIELSRIYKNEDIKKIDDKHFLLDDKNKNIYLENIRIFYLDKLLFSHKFKELEKEIIKFQKEDNLAEITKISLDISLLTVKIINKDDHKEIKEIFNSENIQKNLKSLELLIPLELYAYYKIIEKDEEKTNYYLKIYEKELKTISNESYKENKNSILNIIDNLK